MMRSMFSVSTLFNLAWVALACGDAPKLAVLKFEVTIDGQSKPDVAAQLTDRLSLRIIALERITVIDDLDVSREWDRLTREQQTGTSREGMYAQLARRLHADQLLIPRVVVFGKHVAMTAKLVGAGVTKTINVYEVEKVGDPDVMFAQLDEIVAKMRLDPKFGGNSVIADVALPKGAVEALGLAELYRNSGKTEMALAQIDAAIKAAPEDIDLLERCAALYEGAGAVEKSLETIRQWLTKADGKHPRFQSMLARRVKLEDQIARAPELAAQCTTVVQKFEEAASRKDISAAQAALDRLEKLDSKYVSLGDFRERLQKLYREQIAIESRQLIKQFEEAITRNDIVAARTARNNLARLDPNSTSLDVFDQRIEDLQRDQVANEVRQLINQCDEAIAHKDLNAAQRAYDNLLRLDPNCSSLRAFDQTMQELRLRASIADEVSRLISRFEQAMAWKDASAAQTAYEKIVTLDPKSPLLGNLAERLKALKAITLDLGGGVKMELVLVPAGEFVMGTDSGRNGPPHNVKISRPFYIGKFEVTLAQYRRFKPSHGYKYTNGSYKRFFTADDQPVVLVSWDDARSFCDWLSIKSGRSIRLPTEAEWEYAARAGTTTRYYTGSTISTQQANYDGNQSENGDKLGTGGLFRDCTVSVGTFAPNAFGLHDMAGNVDEWCADWYGEYKWGDAIDPTGAVTGTKRVLRGGTFWGCAGFCRSAARSLPIDQDSPGTGFRVVSGTP